MRIVKRREIDRVLDPLEHVRIDESGPLKALPSVHDAVPHSVDCADTRDRWRRLLAEADEHDDRRARLAIEIFCYRARKYVGGYLAAMGGAAAVVFAGGVGENAAAVRAKICAGLEWAGLTLDPERNTATVGGREGRISGDGARLEAWVIPTDEELLIARDAYRVVQGVNARF